MEQEKKLKDNEFFKEIQESGKKIKDFVMKNESFKKRLVLCSRITGLLFLFSTFFSCIDFAPSHNDSARYMISSLIQSEAAILAIIITLSLVAVQQTASCYSPRVTEIFRNRNPDFWILILIYIISIIYQIYILKLIGSRGLHSPYNFPNHLFITNILNGLLSIENAIWFSYLISIFALVYLIPYISNTLILLTPSRILDILAENITEDQLKLAAQRSKTEDYDDNDPIHPIIDIVSNSLINYDHQTAKKGLTTIEKSTEILKFGNLEEKNFQKISLSIIHHLANVGKLAVKKEDEEFALEILQNIEEIGTESVYQRIGYVSTVAVESITQIGKLAIEQKIPYTAIRSLDLLDQIWETLNREKTKKPIIHTLEFENIKFVIPKIAISIEEIRKLASENNIKIVLDEAEILSKKVYRDLKIEPNNEKNWNNIIWTLKSYEIIKVNEFSTFNESNSNRYDEALGILYKVPEISKNVDTFILEGDIHQKQGKDEEALASYNKATEKEPNSVAAWIFKGNLHLKLREFSNSLNAYERALDVKQDEPFIWYSKGSVFFELNQYDEALFACGKAIAIDKNYENARILKEAILNEQADKNNADFL